MISIIPNSRSAAKLSILLLLIVLNAATSCKKPVDVSDQRDKVRFWSNESFWGDTISVGLSGGGGFAVSLITKRKALTTCADEPDGTARFSTKARDYHYHAVSNTGWEWDGDIHTEVGCNIYQLDSAHARKSQGFPVSFWTSNLSYGVIQVLMNTGSSQAINGTQIEAHCHDPRNANFYCVPSQYTYTAHAANGKTWSDTLSVVDPTCNSIELK